MERGRKPKGISAKESRINLKEIQDLRIVRVEDPLPAEMKNLLPVEAKIIFVEEMGTKEADQDRHSKNRAPIVFPSLIKMKNEKVVNSRGREEGDLLETAQANLHLGKEMKAQARGDFHEAIRKEREIAFRNSTGIKDVMRANLRDHVAKNRLVIKEKGPRLEKETMALPRENSHELM